MIGEAEIEAGNEGEGDGADERESGGENQRIDDTLGRQSRSTVAINSSV